MWIRLHPLLEAVYECRCDWGVIVLRLVLRRPNFTIYRGNSPIRGNFPLRLPVACCLLTVGSQKVAESASSTRGWAIFIFAFWGNILAALWGESKMRETCLFKTRKRLQVIGAGGWTATTEENSARSVRDSHQHTHHGRSSWTWDFQAPKTFHSQG